MIHTQKITGPNITLFRNENVIFYCTILKYCAQCIRVEVINVL